MDGRCRCSGNTGDDGWRVPASLSCSGRVRSEPTGWKASALSPHSRALPDWTGLKSSSCFTPPSSPVCLPSLAQEASASGAPLVCSSLLQHGRAGKGGQEAGVQTSWCSRSLHESRTSIMFIVAIEIVGSSAGNVGLLMRMCCVRGFIVAWTLVD